MRGSVLCLLLVVVAGCAETPIGAPTDDAEEAVGPAAQGAQALAGRLVAQVANATLAPGVAFNVTLDFVATPDASMEQNGTAGADGNGTTGNGTADQAEGNATQAATGNGTDAGNNGTEGSPAARMPWTVTFSNATGNTSYNGTGLPAAFQANLTLLGNVTMTATATWGNETFTMEPLALVVESMAVDPCQGAAVQDPISRSGILGPGAANNGLVSSNSFEVGTCQVGVTVKVTTTTGASDIIIRLITPDSTLEEDANFVGPETLVYAPAGGLTPGAYTAEVRPYAVVADQYQMTITFHERA